MRRFEHVNDQLTQDLKALADAEERQLVGH
jgi:hypothetical protein